MDFVGHSLWGVPTFDEGLCQWLCLLSDECASLSPSRCCLHPSYSSRLERQPNVPFPRFHNSSLVQLQPTRGAHSYSPSLAGHDVPSISYFLCLFSFSTPHPRPPPFSNPPPPLGLPPSSKVVEAHVYIAQYNSTLAATSAHELYAILAHPMRLYVYLLLSGWEWGR